jgi:hypothetical protein
VDVNDEEKVSKLVLGKENNGRESCHSKKGEGSITVFGWERGY